MKAPEEKADLVSSFVGNSFDSFDSEPVSLDMSQIEEFKSFPDFIVEENMDGISLPTIETKTESKQSDTIKEKSATKKTKHIFQEQQKSSASIEIKEHGFSMNDLPFGSAETESPYQEDELDRNNDMPVPKYVKRIRTIILSDSGITDIHVTEGKILWYRKNGTMMQTKDFVPEEGIMNIGSMLFSLPAWGRENCAVTYGGKRLRIRFSNTQNRKQMLLRILPGKAPDLEQIGYHTIFRPQLTNKPTQPGIFLVAGETGSGKSTLLAGVLQEYLNRYPIHIVTVEDPVEYLLFDACGEVSQREIPDDVESFAESVVNVLREDPDIIFFGEMRDPATAIAALTAAETGHMCFCTIHAPDNAGIIDRLLGLLEKISDAPLRLSQAFIGSALLTLTRLEDGAAERKCRILWADDDIKKCIREKRTFDMRGKDTEYIPIPVIR